MLFLYQNVLPQICTEVILLFLLLFYFDCSGSSLLLGLFSSCREQGLLLSCGSWSPRCGGFFCRGVWAPGVWASVVVVPGLWSAGSIVVAQAQLLRGTWNLPGSGIRLMSPALTGRFFTTEPPGQPLLFLFILFIFFCCVVCGILVPSGIKPGAPTVRLPSPTHWTAREFPIILLFQSDLCSKPISQRRFPWLSYLQSHLSHSDAVYLSCFIFFKALLSSRCLFVYLFIVYFL